MTKLNNLERSAQLWCDERVSDRIMDVEFAQVITEALDLAEQRGRRRATKTADPFTTLCGKCKSHYLECPICEEKPKSLGQKLIDAADEILEAELNNDPIKTSIQVKNGVGGSMTDERLKELRAMNKKRIVFGYHTLRVILDEVERLKDEVDLKTNQRHQAMTSV